MNKGMCGGLGKGVTWEIFNFEVIKVKVRVCINWNFWIIILKWSWKAVDLTPLWRQSVLYLKKNSLDREARGDT